MATLRRIAFAALLIALVALAAVFAYVNPEPIDVDVGVVKLERVSMALAFSVVFVCGWSFGLLTAGLILWRSSAEKRRLARSLRYAEAEIDALRDGLVQDAN